MGTHPTFSPSTGPAAAYQPKTTDEADSTVAGGVVPHVNVQGPVTGALTDAATPDISAGGASFSFISLFKGMVSHLLAIRTAQNATAAGTTATSGQGVQGMSGGVPLATTIRSAGTSRSAAVTTTAAVLMAANANRQGWKIKNDGAATVWINFDATATAAAGSGNFAIPAGGYLASEPGFVETGAMSVIAASGTVNLTAREY